MSTRLTSTLIAVALLTTFAGTAADAAETDGYIYGTITTTSGTSYTGVMRWDTEEAFWDDLFHSSKVELPYAHLAPRDRRGDGERRPWWKVLGRKIEMQFGDGNPSRVVIVRFGDIRSITVTGGNQAILVLKDGSELEVSGYSNDVGGPIWIRDASLGDIELKWKKIDTIEFAATPESVRPEGRRLYGVVQTDAGQFEGYIQWDKQECLSTDELDGDADDGRLSIPMGKIQTIERHGRSAARVTLNDGRELVLDGTNDVNDDNRGILVEDARYGRVEIPWSEFERIELRVASDSGRAYDSYAKPSVLRATVTTTDGQTVRGELVYDVDEQFSWEMLNGSADGVEYNIPFASIASIEPNGRHGATITLHNGENLELEDGQDVSENNDGVVVLAGGAERYLDWSLIRKLELE